jgi:Cysteine rich repeat
VIGRLVCKVKDTFMISRIAPYFAAAVSALVFAASLAVTQSTLAQSTLAQSAPAPSITPPAPIVGSPDASVGGAGARRPRGERREGRAAMAACRADMQTLCSTVERGKGNKMRCLIENRAKSSPECQSAILAVEAARSEKKAEKTVRRAEGSIRSDGKRGGRMAACRADTKSLCTDVERGGGRKLACLKANEAKLSPDCAAVVKSLPSRG